jgi:methylenetetrahydrofolate reductase (NADPH)
MKVIEALNKGTPTLSCEFFPPKTKEQEAHLFDVISRLKEFSPDFVSVTYGAMGATREKTFFWVNEIKYRYQIEPIAHLTCVAASRDDIADQLDRLEAMKIENILALRGDPPEGERDFTPPRDGFRLAKDLIAFIKKRKPAFCVGAAGFPEGHPKAPSLEADTEYLKQKVEAGAEYVISQLFFDNRDYFEYLERTSRAGIKVPIIPGLMPITSLSQIRKMTKVCGATIPAKLLERLEKYANDKEAVKKIGAEQATAQCQELLKAKVPGLHFFVMNQAEPISQILASLNLSGHQL